MAPTQAGYAPTSHPGPDASYARPHMAHGSAPGYRTPSGHNIGPMPETSNPAFGMSHTQAGHAPTGHPGLDTLYARPYMAHGSTPGY